MNYQNQIYHKLFNLCQTSWDDSTPPDWIMVRHNTPANGNQCGKKNVYIHHMATKILFVSSLNLSASYPIAYLYLSER